MREPGTGEGRMIVFAGPSLGGVDRGAYPMLDFRPPVRQGDVYLAVTAPDAVIPRAIGIIDGYFEGVPAVWHKEILWALSRGIAVLGAASMGALRAAELDMFGMEGIGAIYADYRDGRLEDDDEVALVHAPAEMGYAALSLAMVNVRATCAAAEAAGVLTPAQAGHVAATAKARFYKQRDWETILTACDRECIGAGDLDRFRAWLPEGEVDQKRADALALLERMAQGDVAPPVADFAFEQTDLWLHTVAHWGRAHPPARPATGPAAGKKYRLFGDEAL